jgi:hypothetical protein
MLIYQLLAVFILFVIYRTILQKDYSIFDSIIIKNNYIYE